MTELAEPTGDGRMTERLGRVAARRGVAVASAANRPVELDDPGFVWFVESGAVDLFLVEKQQGVQQAAPQHVLRAGTGRLLIGVQPHYDETSALELIAKGLPGTKLRHMRLSELEAVDRAELAQQMDAWIADISAMLARGTAHPPMDALLKSGEAPAARSGRVAARRGTVWVTELPASTGLFMDLIDPSETDPSETDPAQPDPGEGGALPLTPATWLTLTQPTHIGATSSAALAERGLLLEAVGAFNRVALSLERLNRRLAVVDQANLARALVSSRRTVESEARHRLLDVHDRGRDDETEPSGLHRVLELIGRRERIEFQRPPETPDSNAATTDAAVARMLAASGGRGRKVRLVPEDRWWVGDSGAMLAFRATDDRPVALLPSALGNYREVDPARGHKRRITDANAGSLKPQAWTFYPSLPATGAGLRDLWRVARAGLGPELARFAATGLAGGLIMLLPAVALGVAADEAIPAGDTGMLYGLSLALVAFGVVRALLHLLHRMSLMRIEGRAASRMEAAFWDRLLRLPTGVLRRYPANDLALRGMAFQNARDAAHGVIGNGVLSILFLAPVFVLIAGRDARLAALLAGFSLASLLVTAALGLRLIGPHDRRLKAVRRLSGRLFQLINGIPRLRVAGAEGSGFALWARGYRKQKRAELDAGSHEAHLRALGTALPSLAGAAVVLATTLLDPDSLAAGDFIVVFVLFLLYQRTVVRLGESFGALAAVLPAASQLRPLLAESTEIRAEGEFVEELRGEVVFDQVSFRHDPSGPLILDEVSIRAGKGEFIAIAGESGAGKSTLLRLALGLEQPSGGSIYFDGRDLQQLDLKQVRRQIGVVPQMVRLHPQDLWDNIVGDHEGATAADAWRAAELAAVDREIAAMPMGLLTPVGAGATLTSGGESQRIQIAHALIRRPRILMLDEATSWLDAETQSTILDNLSGLTSTRIVVAHRLSTLRQADRIYVMKEGRVVQEGTFAALSAEPGAFQNLMSRQLA